MKNVAASVRARLMNLSRASDRPFQEVLQYYGLERFLYRFAQTSHSDAFVLKGALMLRVWGTPQSRPTRDIDFLAYGDNSVEILEQIIRKACETDVEDDGLSFDSGSIEGMRMKEDAEYEGVRVKFNGFLERARIPMQIDIGFGDVVYPGASEALYPTLLDHPAPNLRLYPRETVVAEKFQAMVVLGRLNSRMKDFFDLWMIARQFDFQGNELATAVRKTFYNRNTDIDADPVALTSSFTADEKTEMQWKAFIKRMRIEHHPGSLDEIREPLRQFLIPIAETLVAGETFEAKWIAPGGWQ